MYLEVIINNMETALKNQLIMMHKSGSMDQLIDILSSKFDETDSDLREKLLIDLINQDYGYEYKLKIAEILQKKFDIISPKARDNMLNKFIENCRTPFNNREFLRIIFEIIAKNFNQISVNSQSFFLDYSNLYFGYESYIGDGYGDIFNLDIILAEVIAKNYLKLPENLKSLFIHNFDIQKKPNKLVRSIVACKIIKYYDNFPKEVQELLLKFPQDKEALSEIAHLMPLEGFNKIPNHLQKEIIESIKKVC